MQTIFPDEILSPTEGFGATGGGVTNIDPEALKQHIEELVQQGKVKLGGSDAVPVFVLGFVGGALGSNVLKGTFGTIAGIGLAWWAYNQLSGAKKS
jgi:hypothetical protein